MTFINRECKRLFDEWGAEDRSGNLLKVTNALISNVLAALRTLPGVHLPSTLRQPAWVRRAKESRTFIAMVNGLLDIEAAVTGGRNALRPHTPDWFSAVRLPYDYDPNATCDRWLGFLGRTFEDDADVIAFIREWWGYSLVADTSLQRFLMFVGEGSNGKKVLLSSLENLVGRENCSFEALEDFNSEFRLAGTIGKLLNLCPEIGDTPKLPEGKLKAFVAGDPMSFNRKYRDPIEANPTARLVFATNRVPRFADKSNGIWRRRIIVPCNVHIPKEEEDTELPTKIASEMPGVFNWAIQGLRSLRQRRDFIVPTLSTEAVDEHRSASDPERRFLTEQCEGTGEVEAIGALAIGSLAVGAFALKRGRVRTLTVDNLVVRRLHIGELTVDAGLPR